MLKSASQGHVAAGFVWNTIGSILNALQGVVLLAIITRLGGVYLAGIFSLAYAVGQQYRPLGLFEMRAYQVTDIELRFTFGDYFVSRLITSTAMVVCVVLAAHFSSDIQTANLAIASIALLRLLDAFEDVFHGELQQRDRLDLAGRALSVRIAFTSIMFCIVFFISGDLAISGFVSLALSAAALYFLNIPQSKRVFEINFSYSFRRVRELLSACFPLFVASFLAAWLPNASKFAVESLLSSEDLTYYSILFMPAMAVNLLCGFIFHPLLRNLAEAYSSRGAWSFSMLLLRGMAFIGAAAVLVLIASELCGIPILSMLYSVDLFPYSRELRLLIFAGACNACCTVFYYGLVTLRAQRVVLGCYAIAAVVGLVSANAFTPMLGLLGASASYLVTMSVLGISMLLSVLFLAKTK